MRLLAALLVVCFLGFKSCGTFAANLNQTITLKEDIVTLYQHEPELVNNVFQHLSDKDLIGILRLNDSDVRHAVYFYFETVPLEKMVKLINWMRVTRRDKHVETDLFAEWIGHVLDILSNRLNDLLFNIWFKMIARFIRDVYTGKHERALNQSFANRTWNMPDYGTNLYDLPFLSRLFSRDTFQNEFRLNVAFRFLRYIGDFHSISWIRRHYGNQLWNDTTHFSLEQVAIIESIFYRPLNPLRINQLYVELGVGGCHWPKGFEWVNRHYHHAIWDYSKRIVSVEGLYHDLCIEFSNEYLFTELSDINLVMLYCFDITSTTRLFWRMAIGHRFEMAHELFAPGFAYFSHPRLLNGETFLHSYIRSQQYVEPDILNLIIDSGIHPNVLGRDGQTPLFSCSSILCAKTLLEAGADINIVRTSGSSFLFDNVVIGHVELVQFLVENGADVYNGKRKFLPIRAAKKARRYYQQAFSALPFLKIDMALPFKKIEQILRSRMKQNKSKWIRFCLGLI